MSARAQVLVAVVAIAATYALCALALSYALRTLAMNHAKLAQENLNYANGTYLEQHAAAVSVAQVHAVPAWLNARADALEAGQS